MLFCVLSFSRCLGAIFLNCIFNNSYTVLFLQVRNSKYRGPLKVINMSDNELPSESDYESDSIDRVLYCSLSDLSDNCHVYDFDQRPIVVEAEDSSDSCTIDVGCDDPQHFNACATILACDEDEDATLLDRQEENNFTIVEDLEEDKGDESDIESNESDNVNVRDEVVAFESPIIFYIDCRPEDFVNCGVLSPPPGGIPIMMKPVCPRYLEERQCCECGKTMRGMPCTNTFGICHMCRPDNSSDCEEETSCLNQNAQQTVSVGGSDHVERNADQEVSFSWITKDQIKKPKPRREVQQILTITRVRKTVEKDVKKVSEMCKPSNSEMKAGSSFIPEVETIVIDSDEDKQSLKSDGGEQKGSVEESNLKEHNGDIDRLRASSINKETNMGKNSKIVSLSKETKKSKLNFVKVNTKDNDGVKGINHEKVNIIIF